MTIREKYDTEIKDKIEQLKKRLKNEVKPSMYENDYTFYRFLKARDFNLDQAETMLREHIAWREKYNVDTILKKKLPSDAFMQFFTQTIICYDKEGCPVKYSAYGNMDHKGLCMAAKFSERRLCIIKLMEEECGVLEKQSIKLGKNVVGTFFILDMQNLSFAKASDKRIISDFISLVKLYQDNYPERLKGVAVINASSYFSMGFAVIKSFMASSIVEKFNIYSSPDEWKAAFLKLIDADELPAFLGGNKTDPDGDPMCKSFVNHGRIVPTSLYVHKSTRSLAKSKDVKKLVIPRAAFSEIQLEVAEPGSMIEWEFETKTRDIGFGLFLKELEDDGDEKITELVPLLRLDTEEFSETGMFKCEKAGKYIILFDNSYSWVRSKELYYKANVVTPKEHKDEMMS